MAAAAQGYARGRDVTKEELQAIEDRLKAARIYQEALTRLQELLQDLRTLTDNNQKYLWKHVMAKAYSSDVSARRHGLLLDSAFLTTSFCERLQAVVVEQIELLSEELQGL